MIPSSACCSQPDFFARAASPSTQRSCRLAAMLTLWPMTPPYHALLSPHPHQKPTGWIQLVTSLCCLYDVQGIMCQLMKRVVYEVQGQDTRAWQVQLACDGITSFRERLRPEPCREEAGDEGEHKEEADEGEQDEREQEGEDQADEDMLEAVRAAASRPLQDAHMQVDREMMLYVLCQRATSVPQHLRIAEGLASLLNPAATKTADFTASLKTARKRGGADKVTPLYEVKQAWRVISRSDADEKICQAVSTPQLMRRWANVNSLGPIVHPCPLNGATSLREARREGGAGR
ncbi:unnamed protein product [Chrysoparadoxa australica]